MSVGAARRGRAGLRRRRGRTCAARPGRPPAPARSGSAMIRTTWPSSASRRRRRRAAASRPRRPSRLSATTRASALGRVLISTPTCSPLADADRDQAADDVVDPLVDLERVVGAILEQEEDVLGRCAAAAPRPAARARSACSAGSARAAPAAAADRPPRGVSSRTPRTRAARRPHRGARDPGPDPAGELEAVSDAVANLGRAFERALVGDSVTSSGSSPSPARQPIQRRDGRPRDRVRRSSRRRARSARPQRELVHLGARSGLPDRPHAGSRGDLVDRADDGQDRAARCRPA